MKKKNICLFFLVAGLALFSGCSEDSGGGGSGDDDDDGTLNGPFVVREGKTRYYSLSTGLEVSNPATTDWDIAFSYDRRIYTNSDDTAAKHGSSGNGGVWATEKFVFSNVTATDIASTDFTAEYATDKAKYTSPAVEMGDPVFDSLNFMTFIGYGNIDGTGTSGDSGATGDTPESAYMEYQYDEKQFYIANTATMPPIYTLTQRVYIIQHANGTSHSKIQITAMESITSTAGNRRIYAVSYGGL
ncbi:MAG: HmuY family protein [Spirochaetia bacterium]|nr:HmuY family protein [Spirochaetia bacterium]